MVRNKPDAVYLPSGIRQQIELGTVRGPDRGKMPPVRGGEIGQFQSLANCHVGGIHESDIEPFMLRHEHCRARVIPRLQFFDNKIATRHRVNESNFGTRSQIFIYEVRRFLDHAGGKYQLARIRIDE